MNGFGASGLRLRVWGSTLGKAATFFGGWVFGGLFQ